MNIVMSKMPLLGADDLARQAVLALREKRMADALAFALTFSSTYGTLHPRAFALCAHVLTKMGHSEAALNFWDKAINYCPDRMEWVEQALRTAWATNDTLRAQQYVSLLHFLYCAHPSATFLGELEQHGHACHGACGIHAGHLRAWFILPQGKTFLLRSEPAKPVLQPGTLKKFPAGAHTLYELDVPLSANRDPYCIHLIANGRHVIGSPAYCSPCDAARPIKKIATQSRRRAQQAVTIIIPCYDGYNETLSCLASCFASLTQNMTRTAIWVVWDHGPDSRLHKALMRLSERHKITLLTTPGNMGFLGSVNYALARINEGDVILLNADTLVHSNWIDRMVKVAQFPDAATVTAMGSHAELLSFPAYYDRGDVRTLHETALLDAACRSLPQEMHVRKIPVGMGFCMLLTRRALDLCEGLDGLMLFRGYGEETDFCLRCADQHLKNYAACNVYVAHLEGRSFGASKSAYVAQNNRAIFQRFPHYNDQYNDFLLEDPLQEIRDHISRRACQPREGHLHLYPWARLEAMPRKDKVKSPISPGAQCFVLACGTVTKVLLRISQDVDLADMHFLLPKDTVALRDLVHKCAFTGLMVHGQFRGISQMQKVLDIPVYQAAMDAATTALDEGDLKTAYLVIAPLTLRGWQHFCAYAHKHPAARFWVQHLKQVWGATPRPENIYALPDMKDMRPLQPSALLFTEPLEADRQIAWRTWLDNHGVADIPMGHIPAEAA